MPLDFLTVFVSMFVIIDPLIAIPTFLVLFGKSDRTKQKKAALEATIAALLLLVAFSLFGTAILERMSVSLPAFMIAGGILLLYLSFEFIKGELPKTRSVEKDPSDVIVPVATPLLAGPGAITTSIYFTHTYGAEITLAAIFFVMFLCFFFLYYSTRIVKIIGHNGLKIFTRIMGILTAAIAISLIEKALVAWHVLVI
ncbi:MAG: MarC family protein [Candidatus Aenigmarchaeota archaeon]|nr:MarC family protein [Candidatus Aenigmarchaeota archaeon]